MTRQKNHDRPLPVSFRVGATAEAILAILENARDIDPAAAEALVQYLYDTDIDQIDDPPKRLGLTPREARLTWLYCNAIQNPPEPKKYERKPKP